MTNIEQILIFLHTGCHYEPDMTLPYREVPLLITYRNFKSSFTQYLPDINIFNQ